MAERFGGAVVSLDALPAQLEAADIVVSSTSSPHPIVGSEELGEVIAARGGRPLVLIDIAVPRDIDPACADLPGVTLYDIDDLQGVVARTLEVRAGEAAAAEAIVEEEIQRFAGFLGGMEVLPTVAALRAHADDIVDQVLAENAGKWETASPRDLTRVEAIARAAVNRLLHEPTIRLRAMGAGSSHGRLALLRELFGLERGDESDEESGQRALARRVRIGTRGSALALAQATPVAEALGGELVVITTTGDRRPRGRRQGALGRRDRARAAGRRDRRRDPLGQGRAGRAGRRD